MNMKLMSVIFVVGVLASSGFGTAFGGFGSDDNNPYSFGQKEASQMPHAKIAPDAIIVKFKEGTSDETISMINSKNNVVSSEKIIKKSLKAVENEKTKNLKKHGLDRIHLLKLPENSDVNKMVGKYNENPLVEYAEPNYELSVDVTIPDDSSFSSLWGLHNVGQNYGKVDADIDAPEAWDIQTGSDAIVVAVIDSGGDYNHVDLAANMWVNEAELNGDNNKDDDGNGYVDDIRGWDFCTYGQTPDNDPMDDYGHGTHCSGTIAAVGNNGIGVTGVSWNAKIMPLRFLGSSGYGYTSDAIPAIQYAIDNGAHIMSNSWGGGSSLALKDAISAADSAGILFIAAAGNDEQNNDQYPHYPSSYDVPNIVAVAATDKYDNMAYFSCYGLESVDLGAPGHYIYSTMPGNGYGSMSGTSMATPHVAGAAALIMAQYPAITHTELKAKILDSVDPLSSLAGKTVSGGRLNVYNCFDVNLQPELVVTATSPVKANQGSTFTIDAVISNIGSETATGAEATITLPDGLSTTEDLTKTISDIESGIPASVSWIVGAEYLGTHDILITVSSDNAVTVDDMTTTEVVIPDTEPPTVVLSSPNAGATVAEGVMIFQHTPNDVQSGIIKCELMRDGTSYAVDNTITEGALNEFAVWMVAGAYVWNVKCTDDSLDENEGIGIERTLTVEDQTPPTNGAISIVNTNGITAYTAPDMYLNATGANFMAFSCDGTTFSDWVSFYPVHTNFNINTGAGCTSGDGSKTVYVKFKDDAGNEGAYASDTVILDTAPPVISNVGVSGLTSRTVTITWTTDESANSEVYYGTTTTSLYSSVSDTAMVTGHSISLTGLSMGTTYYYEVRSTDSVGHIMIDLNGGAYYEFTTVSVSPKTISLAPYLAVDTTGADVTAQVQTSDDIHAILGVRKGSGHVEMNFATDIPDGSVINSVIFSYEHHESVYDAVYIEVWDGAEWIKYDGTIRASDTIDSEDLTVILDTETKAESSTIRYVCQHTLGRPEKCYLDHAKLEITYTPLMPEPASMSVTVTSTVSNVNEGEFFTVEAVILNTGDETATGVEAVINLPEGLSTADSLIEIGTISGGESATVSWPVNADTVGTYDITVTASATGIDSASGTTTVNVVTSGGNVMHIKSIEMSTMKVAPNIEAVAKVTIVDSVSGVPVEGVLVSGIWSGLTDDTDYGTSDLNGLVSLNSDGVKKPVGTYTFTVTDVAKEGWTHNTDASVTSGSITVL